MNVTLIFSAKPAILAAKSGATYVSPFVGRLDDQSVAGLEVVRSISELYRIHGIKTQVLSAQFVVFRGLLDPTITEAPSGHDASPDIFQKMYSHVLTDKGLEIFDKDWAKLLTKSKLLTQMRSDIPLSW